MSSTGDSDADENDLVLSSSVQDDEYADTQDIENQNPNGKNIFVVLVIN